MEHLVVGARVRERHRVQDELLERRQRRAGVLLGVEAGRVLALETVEVLEEGCRLVDLAEHVHDPTQLGRDLLQGEHGNSGVGDAQVAVDGDGDEQRKRRGGHERRHEAAARHHLHPLVGDAPVGGDAQVVQGSDAADEVLAQRERPQLGNARTRGEQVLQVLPFPRRRGLLDRQPVHEPVAPAVGPDEGQEPEEADHQHLWRDRRQHDHHRDGDEDLTAEVHEGPDQRPCAAVRLVANPAEPIVELGILEVGDVSTAGRSEHPLGDVALDDLAHHPLAFGDERPGQGPNGVGGADPDQCGDEAGELGPVDLAQQLEQLADEEQLDGQHCGIDHLRRHDDDGLPTGRPPLQRHRDGEGTPQPPDVTSHGRKLSHPTSHPSAAQSG